MGELPTWAQTMLGGLGAGIAIYAGIRADLARTLEIAIHARDAAHRANERIDTLMGLPKRGSRGN